MPSWSIHLKIGKELLKDNKMDKDEFLFGSLIPDTDYGWKLKRFIAHYYGNLKFPKCPNENMVDIESFKKDYKDCLDNDLIKGYYVHLLTDNFYNEYVYYNKWVQDNNEVVGIKTVSGEIIDVKDNYRLTYIYKHKDLELYGKRIFVKEEVIFPEEVERINKSIKLLKDNFVSEENVKERIEYLHKDYVDNFLKITKGDNTEYVLFTEEELDNLLKDCLEYIRDKIKELN